MTNNVPVEPIRIDSTYMDIVVTEPFGRSGTQPGTLSGWSPRC